MKYVNCRTRGRDSSARSSGTDPLQVLAIFPVKIGHHFQVTLLVLDVGVEEIGFSLDHLPPPEEIHAPHFGTASIWPQRSTMHILSFAFWTRALEDAQQPGIQRGRKWKWKAIDRLSSVRGQRPGTRG